MFGTTCASRISNYVRGLIVEISQVSHKNDLECEPYVIFDHDVQLQNARHVEDDGNNEQNVVKKVINPYMVEIEVGFIFGHNRKFIVNIK